MAQDGSTIASVGGNTPHCLSHRVPPPVVTACFWDLQPFPLCFKITGQPLELITSAASHICRASGRITLLLRTSAGLQAGSPFELVTGAASHICRASGRITC